MTSESVENPTFNGGSEDALTKAEMIETVLLAWEDADPDTARLRLARLGVEALLRTIDADDNFGE